MGGDAGIGDVDASDASRAPDDAGPAVDGGDAPTTDGGPYRYYVFLAGGVSGAFASGADPFTTADAICADRGKGLGTGRKWKALLWTSSGPSIIGPVPGGWFNTQDLLVFDSPLGPNGNDGGVARALLFADGSAPSGAIPSYAWTGGPDKTQANCGNWSEVDASGAVGTTGAVEFYRWIGTALANCSLELALYCFEQQ